MNPEVYQQDLIDSMYPDVFKQMYPHVVDVADRMGNTNLNRENLDTMANEVLSRMKDVPVFSVGGYGERGIHDGRYEHGYGYYRDQNRHHGNLDLARILLLRELFDRRGRRWGR